VSNHDRTLSTFWNELKPIGVRIPPLTCWPDHRTESVADASILRNARTWAIVIIIDLINWFKLPAHAQYAISTIRMSHDEERANGVGLEQKSDRAPRHWLDPLVRRLRRGGCGNQILQF
jgi:hypothetical protein